MKKVTNGFRNLSLSKFHSQLAVIVAAMTGNPNFPTLQAQVTALSTAADNYYSLAAQAEARDKNVVIARNAARIEITNTLHTIGFNVTAISNGDEGMLSSSGFPFTKIFQKSLPLTQPTPPKVSLGANKGAIKVKTKRQKGTISYNYYLTPVPASGNLADATWDKNSHNAATYHFTGLISSQPYLIKVGLVGVRGQEVISEPITYTPQ